MGKCLNYMYIPYLLYYACYMYVYEHINGMYGSPCASVAIVTQPHGRVLVPHITCILY